MGFRIGQRVSYPNHGVCAVEGISSKQVSDHQLEFYSLRVLSNNSLILVPKDNTENIGVRPIISSGDCRRVMETLAQNFEDTSGDWKVRIKDFSSRLQSGCIFEAVDVLKQLSYLSSLKPLSFREQRFLERAKFLVVSELAVVCSKSECDIEEQVDDLLSKAMKKHMRRAARAAAHASH